MLEGVDNRNVYLKWSKSNEKYSFIIMSLYIKKSLIKFISHINILEAKY